VKSVVTDRFGEDVSVLYVKGSGWDLGNIGPRGFACCRLAPLLKCLSLAAMSDEEMVSEQRAAMLDPSGPTPSVEALLHAILPGKYVDHTHADGILALVSQPDSEARVREALGEVLFVPYVMPGFSLAKRVAELLAARPATAVDPGVMVLDKHGIFTWGDSAEESYSRMLAAVTQASRYVSERSKERVLELVPAPSADRIVRSLPVLRGALGRVSGQPWIASLRTTDATLRFAARGDAAELLARGPVTPDHALRTKGVPLVLDSLGAAPEASRETVEAAIRAFAERYDAYVRRSLAARGVHRKAQDPYPRVALVPGLGLVTFGRTTTEAEIAADIAEHTLAVVDAAAALGGYEPVSELDRFDVEYWSLEQAKLGKAAPARPLDRHIAWISGAASGIGLATARAMLMAGAHVVLTDKDAEAVEQRAEELAVLDATRVAWARCDVTDASDVARALAHTVARFGGVDILVSNAGGVQQGLLDDADGEAALRVSLELNLWGHQNVARAGTAILRAQGTGGALLFNASKSAFNPGAGFGPYAVAKAATVALMRQYAVDLGALGIRANAVNADRVRTGLFSDGVLESRAAARGVPVEAYFSDNLLRRETLAEDVAQAFVYLAAASGTTGAVLPVDGGNAAAFPR
jgi:rhamnose utilization protein RhaD (predicted bifunctional aldolase and dehydrogenase)/NAD(P)-dependent dehydrogenase (short-subunit alcohol dehydrogenase family)